MRHDRTPHSEGIEHRYQIIEWVDHLIQRALSQQASDIHIEPYHDAYRIRFRLDGLLREIEMITLPFVSAVITRIKIMAHLNIAERRLPQDGHIRLHHLKLINIRISICPTKQGEKIVMRLLNTNEMHKDMTSLGMTNAQVSLFTEALHQPQGLILITGPTGSGKSSTLYAALHYLNQPEKNLCSVEDPIEIELPGVNQVNIHPRIDLHFATILRALLRQDPDVLMIGEIRDLETATIALQAAQTGHLVLSTLHCRFASDALSRLSLLGAPSNILNETKPLIIAQRLLRTICCHCHGQHPLTCDHCYDGYAGRTGIFELLHFHHNTQTCHLSLQEAAWIKVKEGITTLSEVHRVLGEPA